MTPEADCGMNGFRIRPFDRERIERPGEGAGQPGSFEQ